MKKLLIGLTALLACSSALAGTAPFPDPIYVRGGFNDWGLANSMTYNNDGTYTAQIAIAAGDWEFKIADEGWSNPDWGAAGDPVVTLGVATEVGPASFGNLMLSLANSGNYLFTLFNLTDPIRGVPASGQLIVTQVVPVPAAVLLLLSAISGLGFLRRQR